MAKEFAVEYKARDWIDPKQLRLSPEDLSDLVSENMFRVAFLDLKIRVVALVKGVELSKGQEKAFEINVTKAAWGARARLREEAKGVFVDVVNAWRAEKNPGMATGDEAKTAIAAVKKLDESMKELLRVLPRDLREAAGDALKMSPDDFVTVNESDYDIRLRTDLLAGLKDSEEEEESKEQNEKLKQRLSKKGEWLECCVVWLSSAVGRLLVAKPGKPVKVKEAKDEGKLLDESKMAKKSQGKLFVTGSKLKFEFLDSKKGLEGGPLPGGSSPEAPLKKLIGRQTGKQYQVSVEFVSAYSNKQHAVDDREARDTEKGSKDAEGKDTDKSTDKGRPTKIDDVLVKKVSGMKTKDIEELMDEWTKDDVKKLLDKMKDGPKNILLKKASMSKSLKAIFPVK